MKFSSEQNEVLNTKGSLILSAGAGAGKTFIVVEYLIKYFTDLLDEHKNQSLDDYVKEELRLLCVVTFTKRATLELKERIEKKLQVLKEEDKRFQSIYKNINYLFVGTIHALCLKVLKDKNILRHDQELVSEVAIKRKILNLTREGINILEKNRAVFDFNEKALVETLFSIFNDATQRMNYKDDDLKGHKDYIEMFFLKNTFEIIDKIDDPKKAWEKQLNTLLPILKEEKVLKKFDLLNEFFKQRASNPRGADDISENVEVFFKDLKKFKENFKAFSQIIEDFKNNKENYEVFHNGLVSIFSYIEKNYFKDHTISYADIEYLMSVTEENISLSLKKIIVDEFQDTSAIQTEVIKKLSPHPESYFFVGDKKQAIYGFRGGDVRVFSKEEKNIKNLSLTQNFRSQKKIVDFNNNLFSSLLDFKNTSQTTDSEGGEVSFYDTHSLPEKANSNSLRKIEAMILGDLLNASMKKSENETYAVLYKSLTGVNALIEVLLDKKIPFMAELKINYSDEPLLEILMHLLSMCLASENESIEIDKCLYFSNGILFHFGCKEKLDLRDIEKFKENILLHGVYFSFCDLLASKKISVSDYRSNLFIIKEICFLFKNNKSEIFHFLNSSRSQKIKIGIKKDVHHRYVELLSIHSSKGLEFDWVGVADLHHTNQVAKFSELSLGSISAFRFKDFKSYDFKTPQYFFNLEDKKKKELDEDKRLFYVASTRAKKTLNFVCFDEVSIGKKPSWADYLKMALLNKKTEKIKVTEKSDSSIKQPFIKYDLGIREKKENLSFIGCDVSVSSLSKLEFCPHYFYLSEVLKIQDNDLREIKLFPDFKEKEKKSSLKRGNSIHFELEKYFKDGIKNNNSKHKNEVDFVIEEFSKLQSSRVFSEQEMKFSYKQFMVSGIIDLLIIDDSKKEVFIWDYKTGDIADHKEMYIAQLKTYLYGVSQVFNLDNYKLNASLILIDERKKIDFKESIDDLDKFLYELFLKKSSYFSKNLELCNDCTHQNICSK